MSFNQMNTGSIENTGTYETAESEHQRQLDSLLSKLRPFQRKAFEFAVHGVIPLDDSGTSGNNDGGRNAGNESDNKASKYFGESSVASNDNGSPSIGNSRSGTNAMAGAGTGRILLGDEMGLGKTLSSLAIMLAYKPTEWPLLILCPASLRYTWPAEIEKFCPWIPSTAIHVVRGKDDVQFAEDIKNWREKQLEGNDLNSNPYSKPKNTPSKSPKIMSRGYTNRPPIQIVIVTYSLLQTRYAVAHALPQCNFQCIIADESHNLKQLKSQRCELALPLLQKSKRLVLLSGTPALNRPVELWPQLTALDPHGQIFEGVGKMDRKESGSKKSPMRFMDYAKRYCNAKRTRFGWDFKGSSHADELHGCLKKVMMRRLKSQVLQDLPSKQRSIVPVTISDKAKEKECRDMITDMNLAREALSEIVDADYDDVANSAKWEARRLLMQAYQMSGIAKAPSTTDYILDWLEGSDPSQKLVVFAHHKEVIEYIETTINKAYKGRLGMIKIDGAVNPAERALRVRKFQNNSSVRLALLSMTAAGVGLTLTAASSIIFAELHWTPGVLAQAEDRCHRIGQQNAVNVMYCICKDEEVSVDRSLWAMLGRKVGNLGRVVDGQKGQGLDAIEKEADLTTGGGSPGNGKASVSGEEDLASFFASASPVSVARHTGKPVKGSIQSFFQKQAGSKQSPAMKSSNTHINPNQEGKIPFSMESTPIPLSGDSEITMHEMRFDNKPMSSSKSESLALTTFNCHVCTYENKSSVKACTMCGTPKSNTTLQHETSTSTSASASDNAFKRKQNSRPAHKFFMPLTKKSESSSKGSEQWTCSTCTYINKRCRNKNAPKCEICGTTKESEDSIICLDSDIERVPKSDRLDFFDYEKTIDLPPHQPLSSQVSQSPAASSSTSGKASPGSDINWHGSEEPIIVDIESEAEELDSCRKRESQSIQEFLTFSVSKNSGRIALHLLSDGRPLHVNFDISQVLTKECSDKLEELNLQRIAPHRSSVPSPVLDKDQDFDDDAIKQVLGALDEGSIFPPPLSFKSSLNIMCNDLKSFVFFYLGLREVEKKALKDSGQAVAASSVKRSAGLMLASTVTGFTSERYTGGAKERAFENLKRKCATELDMKIINGQACAWCAKLLLCASDETVDATYCSQSCAEEGRVRRGGWFASTKIREQLFALENGICKKCNINAHALFLRVKSLEPPERLNALLNAKWKLPQTSCALDRLLQDPQEKDFWEADHVVAVSEGGGGCGLDNFRTLCKTCHNSETAHLRSRLKTSANSSQPENEKERAQMDIVSAFSKARQSHDGGTCGRKKRKRRRAAD